MLLCLLIFTVMLFTAQAKGSSGLAAMNKKLAPILPGRKFQDLKCSASTSDTIQAKLSPTTVAHGFYSDVSESEAPSNTSPLDPVPADEVVLWVTCVEDAESKLDAADLGDSADAPLEVFQDEAFKDETLKDNAFPDEIVENETFQLQISEFSLGPSNPWSSLDQAETIASKPFFLGTWLSMLDDLFIEDANDSETNVVKATEVAESETVVSAELSVSTVAGSDPLSRSERSTTPQSKFKIKLSAGALKAIQVQNEQQRVLSEADTAVPVTESAVGPEQEFGIVTMRPSSNDRVEARISQHGVAANSTHRKVLVHVLVFVPVIWHTIQLQWALFILDLKMIGRGLFAAVQYLNLTEQWMLFLLDLRNACNIILRLVILAASIFVHVRFDASGHVQAVSLGWLLKDFCELKRLLHTGFKAVLKVYRGNLKVGLVCRIVVKLISSCCRSAHPSDRVDFASVLNAMSGELDVYLIHSYIGNCRIHLNLLKALYFALDLTQITGKAELIAPFLNGAMLAKLPAWKASLLIDIYMRLMGKKPIYQQVEEFKGSSVSGERLKQLLELVFYCEEFTTYLQVRFSAKELASVDFASKYETTVMDELAVSSWISLVAYYLTCIKSCQWPSQGLYQNVPGTESGVILAEVSLGKRFTVALNRPEHASLDATVTEETEETEETGQSEHSDAAEKHAQLADYYLNADKALESWILFNNIAT